MQFGDFYLSIIDVLVVLPLFWAVYRGFMTGFIVEALALAVFLAGIYVYIRVAEIPGVISPQIKEAMEYLPLAIFMIFALVAFILSNLTETLTHRSQREVAKGPINRSVGALLSMFRYLVLLSSILMFIQKIDQKYNFLSSNERYKAMIYTQISGLLPGIFPYLEFEFVDNRYINYLKRAQLKNVSMGEIEDGTLAMNDAMFRIKDEAPKLYWEVYDKGKKYDKHVVVELNLVKEYDIIQKSASLRFRIQREDVTKKFPKGTKPPAYLINVQINGENATLEEGYQILRNGKL